MKRVPRIESDTPIIPRAIAEAVLEEASVWLNEPLPRRWIRELTARANTVYAHNERFRRKLRGQRNAGRDWLWVFTRHWLAALIREHRPHLHRLLPASYNTGDSLPPRPAVPTRRVNQTCQTAHRRPARPNLDADQAWAAAAHFHFA